MKRILLFIAAAVAVALTVAACGARATAGTTTVGTKQIGGVGKALVDASGMALYTNDQEASGMVLCNGTCTSVWRPLTIAHGSPTGTTGGGALGVLTRSDGTRQVTLNGKPLYTFYLDQPGKVTGNSFRDSFGGQHFTWHVALAGNATASPGSGQSGGGGGATIRY